MVRAALIQWASLSSMLITLASFVSAKVCKPVTFAGSIELADAVVKPSTLSDCTVLNTCSCL